MKTTNRARKTPDRIPAHVVRLAQEVRIREGSDDSNPELADALRAMTAKVKIERDRFVFTLADNRPDLLLGVRTRTVVVNG